MTHSVETLSTAPPAPRDVLRGCVSRAVVTEDQAAARGGGRSRAGPGGPRATRRVPSLPGVPGAFSR